MACPEKVGFLLVSLRGTSRLGACRLGPPIFRRLLRDIPRDWSCVVHVLHITRHGSCPHTQTSLHVPWGQNLTLDPTKRKVTSQSSPAQSHQPNPAQPNQTHKPSKQPSRGAFSLCHGLRRFASTRGSRPSLRFTAAAVCGSAAGACPTKCARPTKSRAILSLGSGGGPRAVPKTLFLSTGDVHGR